MKRTLFQFLNLLMACIVLLSSTGFGLLEHSCHMRGKKKTLIVAFTAKTQVGCSVDNPSVTANKTAVRKAECCQDEQHYENVDISSSLSQFVAKLVKVLAEAVLAGVVSVFTWFVDWVFAKDSATVSVFPSPPSFSGRDILTLVSRLLI